jgi:hypothetical protein
VKAVLVRRSLVRAQVEEPLNARSGSDVGHFFFGIGANTTFTALTGFPRATPENCQSEAASAHSDVADLNHPASDLAYLSPSPEPRLDWSLIAFSVVYFAVYLESVIWFIFA